MPKEPKTLQSTGRLLTPKERGWTMELEQAIASAPDRHDFERMSDFEVAAHAIVAKDDTALAMKRIRRLKLFKDNNSIISHEMTVFQAMQSIHKFFHAYPEFVQAVGVDTYNRQCICFKLSVLTSPPPFNHTETERFTALFYIFHALQPDLDAVRKGTVWLGDLEDVTRQTLMSNYMIQPNALYFGGKGLTVESYPIKVKDFPCINAPTKYTQPALYMLCWPFFSKKLTKKYIPCTQQQIKEHFPKNLLPRSLGGTMSTQQVLEVLEEKLQKRYDTEQAFRL
jgi:hypothetical protein